MDILETKRGTTPLVSVKINGVDKPVAKVEFVFKQKGKETAEPLVYKFWDGSADSTVIVQDEDYIFSLSEQDTRQFKADTTYFMDTRITYEDGSIPVTNIIKFMSLLTLFEDGE